LTEKEIVIEIKKPEIYVLTAFLLVALALNLMVTLPSPIAFGDEGYHTTMAQYIAGRQEYFAWQPFETDGLIKHGFIRPPLWNFLEASFFFLFGFSETLVKFLAPFIGTILVGAATYVLVKKLFNKNVALIAAIIIISVPSFATHSVLFTTEMLLILYVEMFFFVLVLGMQTESKKYLMLSGIFGGLALLIKTTALVVFPTILLAFLYETYKDGNYKNVFKKFFIVAAFLALVYGTFFLRNFVLFNITGTQILDFITKSKTDIIFSYTSKFNVTSAAPLRGTGLSVINYGIKNYIEFAYGNPWFVFLGLLGGFIVLAMKRSKADMLLAIMLVSYLPVLYQTTLGGRVEDASRLALVILPVIAVIAAIYFDTVYDFIKNYYKKLALIVFVLVIVLSMQQLYTKLLARDDKRNYVGMMGVKQFSPLFFDACDFIKKNTTANSLLLTIWDHQAVYNCQRNVITPNGLPDQGDIELSKDVNLSVSRLKVHGITHVFIQKFSISPGIEQDRYPIDFINFMNDNPKNFKKIFENGASIETCASQDSCSGNIVYEVV